MCSAKDWYVLPLTATGEAYSRIIALIDAVLTVSFALPFLVLIRSQPLG